MEPEFQQANQSTNEEDVELEKSVRKSKDNPYGRPFVPTRTQVSYKDNLLGDIPGAYAQAFRFERVDEPEVEFDTELNDIVEGMVDVKLSQETKSRIRAPWTKALIVKVYESKILEIYLHT